VVKVQLHSTGNTSRLTARGGQDTRGGLAIPRRAELMQVSDGWCYRRRGRVSPTA
jgi:hypothetical protein